MTKRAPNLALTFIASGKLNFDESIELHRVVRSQNFRVLGSY